MERRTFNWVMLIPSAYIFTPVCVCYFKGVVDAFIFKSLFKLNESDNIYSSGFVQTRISSIICIQNRIRGYVNKECNDKMFEIDRLNDDIRRTENRLKEAGNVRGVRLQLEKEEKKRKQNELIKEYIIPAQNFADRKLNRVLKRYELQVVGYFIGVAFTNKYSNVEPQKNKNLEILMTPDEYKNFKNPIIPEAMLSTFSI